MSVEENKALVRRWIDEAHNKGDISVVDEVLATEYVQVGNGLKRTETKQTPEDNKKGIQYIREAFPDVRWNIDQMVGEGDVIAVALTSTGTHRGTFWDCAPTDKKGRVTQHLFIRFEGGKIVEIADASGLGRYVYAMVSGQLHKEQEEAQSK